MNSLPNSEDGRFSIIVITIVRILTGEHFKTKRLLLDYWNT